MRQPISVRQSQATMSEVLQYVTQHKDIPSRIQALRENDTKAMRSFCRLAFGPEDAFLGLRGAGVKPTFRCRLENVASTESFYDVVRALERATDPANSVQARKDTVNDLLDWLCPKEADIIMSIFNGKVEIPGLPEVVVRSAFPELL